ncbi:TonB-dependent receptor, partial [Pseudanabaenaceae cyanobacterium LEGE 13415]|nr:TonB-dependent receptor [Pseudanabaenaceae cyanobacterium LEGE 13415]
DVPFDYGGFLDLGLLDLERVEVLRGPQSTLYGRSSPAGVVNIISRAPTNTPEVRIQGGYGSYNFREAQLTLSDAIVPNQLAFRLSGAYRAQDGFFRNAFLDRTVGDRNQLLGRAQLLWTPSKEWNISFNSYVLNNDNGDVVFTRRDGDPFATFKAVDGFNQLDSNTQALRIGYDGAGFRATSITARRGTRQNQLIGDAFFPGVDSLRSIIDIDSTVWSQEIRLQSPSTANRVRWLLGGYYESRAFNVNNDGIEFTPTGAAAFGLPSAGLNRVRADQNRATYAAFGQIDYKPIDPLTLFAGLRFESSRLSLDRERTFETGGVVSITNPQIQDQLTSSELIPRFGAQYRFSPNVAVYATIAKGYRPNGFNYRADTESVRRFGEERTWTYEAGIKSSWFNDRLTANLAVFHNDVDGYQVLLVDDFGFFRNVTNANVKATGAELELRAQVSRGFEVIAGLGYVDSRFKNYRNPFTGTDFSDNRVPYSPNLTYNLALQYRSPGGIFARAELRGFGRTFFDDANLVEQTPFALINLRLGYEWRNYGIYLFANNLFDTRYITTGFLFPPPRVTAGFGEPVTVGFQVRANF